MSINATGDADDSSTSDVLDMRNEEGWEDVEPDEIEENFVSLFDDKQFSHLLDMLTYCKDKYEFDIWQLQRRHTLDFLGLIRLVNYVRKQVKSGNRHPDVNTKSNFEDEIFLLPVLEDDAVLYSLEDVLQADPASAPSEVDELREQLTKLQSQFAAYREDVQKYLNTDVKAVLSDTTLPNINELWKRQDDEYFKSYSYNSIHETMLKDKIRTDAYRDFIYDNKDVFKDKIVLDVGCGTGILSMFCAKAGAKQVIAVDNSDIVEKAKQNIASNHLESKIQCIRGKIEEVSLPVQKVDIIVSEWMGYCLFFESMLDSVIYARDKYLAKGGLMVPSHVTIELAPLSDSELRVSYIDFWKDVYGFDMTSMLEKAEEEVLIRVVDANDLAAESARVLQLDLHTAKVQDLNFTGTFELDVKTEGGLLEGFVLWFDTYFMTSSSADLSSSLSVDAAKSRGIVAFSTGPATQPTHWQQGVCLINEPNSKLTSDTVIMGKVTYAKQSDSHRALNINIDWIVTDTKPGSQRWSLQ